MLLSPTTLEQLSTNRPPNHCVRPLRLKSCLEACRLSLLGPILFPLPSVLVGARLSPAWVAWETIWEKCDSRWLLENEWYQSWTGFLAHLTPRAVTLWAVWTIWVLTTLSHFWLQVSAQLKICPSWTFAKQHIFLVGINVTWKSILSRLLACSFFGHNFFSRWTYWPAKIRMVLAAR